MPNHLGDFSCLKTFLLVQSKLISQQAVHSSNLSTDLFRCLNIWYEITYSYDDDSALTSQKIQKISRILTFYGKGYARYQLVIHKEHQKKL